MVKLTPVSFSIYWFKLKAFQFRRLKYGDRHFHTHKNEAGKFTNAQKFQLRARTLGDIICENSQQIQTQKNVFVVQSNR